MTNQIAFIPNHYSSHSHPKHTHQQIKNLRKMWNHQEQNPRCQWKSNLHCKVLTLDHKQNPNLGGCLITLRTRRSRAPFPWYRASVRCAGTAGIWSPARPSLLPRTPPPDPAGRGPEQQPPPLWAPSPARDGNEESKMVGEKRNDGWLRTQEHTHQTR